LEISVNNRRFTLYYNGILAKICAACERKNTLNFGLKWSVFCYKNRRFVTEKEFALFVHCLLAPLSGTVPALLAQIGPASKKIKH